MDYCKLSDFEINKAVAEIAINGDWLLEPTDESPSWFFNHGVQGKNTVKLPDYCNNPADAWPIITANKISIYAMSEADKRGGWGAEAFHPNDAYSFNDNPLRAAMVVFLMMQESEPCPD
ncbi:DUF2591 family protein [Enterobacter hormaechei]|nr:DUF2591 family protein [Enterobacter hormaechei]